MSAIIDDAMQRPKLAIIVGPLEGEEGAGAPVEPGAVLDDDDDNDDTSATGGSGGSTTSSISSGGLGGTAGASDSKSTPSESSSPCMSKTC